MYQMASLPTFEQAFWGAEYLSTAGFDTISQRVSEGKSLCKDIELYFKQRSKMEADYSKSLTSLYKSLKARDNIGQLEFAYNVFRHEIEEASKLHNEASQYFSELANETKTFTDDVNTKRKATIDKMKKAQQSKVTNFNKMTTAKKQYTQKCKDFDIAEQNFASIEGSVTATIKEIEKVRNTKFKCEEQRSKCDQTYKDSIKALEMARESWENEHSQACVEFQALEEERIKFTREMLWTSTNVDSKMARDTNDSGENVRVALNKCEVQDDICAFIEKFRTGEERPEFIPYESYYGLYQN